MNQETKDKLRLIPRTSCFECQSKKSSTNPIERCDECKKKFCFDHLYGGQIKEGMSKNEEARSVCEECKTTHDYQTL